MATIGGASCVADFGERQHPVERGGHARIRSPHTTAPAMQFAICYSKLFSFSSSEASSFCINSFFFIAYSDEFAIVFNKS